MLNEILVQWFAGDDCERFRAHRKNGGDTQMQLTLVADDLPERQPIANGLAVRIVILIQKPRRGERFGFSRLTRERQGLPLIPGADLTPCPGTIPLLQACQRLDRRILPTLQTRREFIADCGVSGLQAAQLRMYFRRDHKAGELSRKEVKCNEPQRKQQNHWNHADENVGDDQPVPHPPQEFLLEPAKCEDRKKNRCDEDEKGDPSPKVLAPGRREQPEQLLQEQQHSAQAEEVTGDARHSAFWPESSCAQAAPKSPKFWIRPPHECDRELPGA